jgi:plastocyanin
MTHRLALAAALTLACAVPAVLFAAPATVEVPIKNFSFMPMEVAVPVGGSVTWKNLDGEPHTVTSTEGLFRSGALDQGDSFTFKFTRAGTYPYICSIHPQMRARLVVR